MKYITHFTIVETDYDNETEKVIFWAKAYLNATSSTISKPSGLSISEGQASIVVCRGTEQECEQFVNEQKYLETAYQWLGYLVAGGIGSALTLIFQSLRT